MNDKHHDRTKHIISHIFNGGRTIKDGSASFQSRVCALCLNPTTHEATIEDEYEFRRQEFSGTVTVAEMIATFSGIRIADSILPKSLCVSCMEGTVTCFLFTKLCHNAYRQWNKLVNILHNKLNINNGMIDDDPKTVYLFLNKDVISVLKDDIVADSEKSASNRLKKLVVKRKRKYVKKEKDVNIKKKDVKVFNKMTKVVNEIKVENNIDDSDRSYSDGFSSNDDKMSIYYSCDSCTKKYKSKSILKQHFKNEHKAKSALKKYKCTLCEKTFDCKRTLYTHGYVHRETKSDYSCMKCTKIFSYPSSLKKHMKLIHGEKKYKCTECPKSFVREFMLNGHMKDVHSGYQYVCTDCGRSFKTKSSLRFHEESHRQKTCKNCGKTYKCKKSYQEHEKLCSKGNIPTNLNITKVVPVDTYDGVQQYICDHCGKIFFRKQSLLIHVKNLHLHQKMFSCEKCGKKFRTKGQVKCHDIVHTRERNEKCDICGRYFITKYALIYHMRLHTGERPFRCDLCEEKFISSSRLQSHKRTKHWGPSQECTVCYSKFFTKYALRVHTKRHFNPTSKLFCKTDVTAVPTDFVEN